MRSIVRRPVITVGWITSRHLLSWGPIGSWPWGSSHPHAWMLWVARGSTGRRSTWLATHVRSVGSPTLRWIATLALRGIPLRRISWAGSITLWWVTLVWRVPWTLLWIARVAMAVWRDSGSSGMTRLVHMGWAHLLARVTLGTRPSSHRTVHAWTVAFACPACRPGRHRDCSSVPGLGDGWGHGSRGR